jgi:hypothetical protein
MEIGFLTKQIQIITNAVIHYCNNVLNQTGVEFYKASEEHNKDIEKNIAKEQKPKVRNKATITFSLLYKQLHIRSQACTEFIEVFRGLHAYTSK